MFNRKVYKVLTVACMSLLNSACKLPAVVEKNADKNVPANYNSSSQDTTNSAKVEWKDYFTDP